MAGNNHMSRGGYSDDRNPTNYMGRGGYSDDRNTSNYGVNAYSDHVCRPVIIDAEGRKRPIISYGSQNTSSESYVTTRTERIVEQVRAPVVVTDYKYSSQAKVEPLKEYDGVTNDKWPNPSNQVYDRPEYGYSSQSKLEPARNYGVTNDNWRSSPLNASQDRPPKVEDFITKVQTEASRPTRAPLVSATHWRNTPSSTGQGSGGGEYANYNNNNSNSQLSRPITEIGKAVEILKDGVKPSSIAKAAPQSTGQGYGATTGYGGEYANYNNNSNNQLSRPINEIGKTLEMLKDGVKPSSIATAAVQSWSPLAATTIPPKRDGYNETIDSREAAKRYGNLVRPFQTGENYTGTIDSREAARRYGGAAV
jgi:hypothetical protein